MSFLNYNYKSPGNHVGTGLRTYLTLWSAELPQITLHTRRVDDLRFPWNYFSISIVDLAPKLQDQQYLLQHIHLDSLSQNFFLELRKSNTSLSLSNQFHQIILICLINSRSLLDYIAKNNPNIQILTFWFLYFFDQVISTEYIGDLIDKIAGEFASVCQIFLGRRMIFDEVVDLPIVLGEVSVENFLDTLLLSLLFLLSLHKRNIIMDSWQGFKVGRVQVSWREVVLTLNRGFNTAHSSSLERRNFLVKIKVEGVLDVGMGEGGLPPKKPNCYLADINDCKIYMKKLQNTILKSNFQVLQEKIEDIIKNIFEGIPQEYFKMSRYEQVKTFPQRQILQQLLMIVFIARDGLLKEERAPYSALEFAIFDFWSRMVKFSLTDFIFSAESRVNQHNPCSFYSISHQDHSSMIKNVLEGLKYTHFIKLKAIDDVSGLITLMQKLQTESKGVIIKYIIDANASWSADSCQQLIIRFNNNQNHNIRDKILYLEQPFPVIIQKQEQNKWIKVYQESNIKIVADQSIFGEEQIGEIACMCSGINIKTEKAGGVINSLKAGLKAKNLNMDVMLGSMVSTHLGCTQTYCLHPLTPYLDTDGAILVKHPQIQGGFVWGSQGYLIPRPNAFGTTIDNSSLL